jgi:predicted DNA-binding transcriptional regulator AlpA
MMKVGSFPQTVQLTPNRVGFRTSDLKKWVGGVK